MKCFDCTVGSPDADETCSCPQHGPRTLAEDAPALAAIYVATPHEEPSDWVFDSCDFATWLNSDVHPDEWRECEKALAAALAKSVRVCCDCDRGWLWYGSDRERCPACWGTGRTYDAMPRLLVGTGEPGDGALVCCDCLRDVAMADHECGSCGAQFPAGPALAARLKESGEREAAARRAS